MARAIGHRDGFMIRGMCRYLYALICSTALAAMPAYAQPYPSKPLRMIVGLPAGGSFPIQADYAEQVKIFSAYVQDDWKVSRKLTFSLGLQD